jgi:hypothetical protein
MSEQYGRQDGPSNRSADQVWTVPAFCYRVIDGDTMELVTLRAEDIYSRWPAAVTRRSDGSDLVSALYTEFGTQGQDVL